MSGAKLLILVGLILALLGTVWLLAPQGVPKLFAWFGRLPGDLRFSSGGLRVFVPITSMLIVSAVLTLVMRLLR